MNLEPLTMNHEPYFIIVITVPGVKPTLMIVHKLLPMSFTEVPNSHTSSSTIK